MLRLHRSRGTVPGLGGLGGEGRVHWDADAAAGAGEDVGRLCCSYGDALDVQVEGRWLEGAAG